MLAAVMELPKMPNANPFPPIRASHKKGQSPQGLHGWLGIAIVLLVATAIIAPFPFLENASGHDIAFHIQSWMDASRQWRQGVLFPRWAAWANFGYGEPRFIFYPPISWTLGAALGQVLEWRMVPGALIWLMLVMAAAGMFHLAREWLSPRDSLAAAVLYMANPYQFVVVYYRSDFAELVAGAIFPWLVLYTIRIGRSRTRGIIGLSVAFAAIWLSNAPAAVIATYSLALLLVAESTVEKSARTFARGCAAMAAGFGLAAFYILPAAWEQKWVQIQQALGPALRPAENFLFAHSDDPDFQLFNWKVSSVAIAMILVTAIAIGLAMRRKREAPQIWWPLATLGAASALLMFPFSGIVWRLLPKLQFVQFPWRWLMPLGVVFAMFTAAALARAHRRWIGWIVLAIALGSAAVAIAHDAWWDSEDIPQVEAAIQSDAGYEGTDEYQPLASDRSDLRIEAPRVAAIIASIDTVANSSKMPADQAGGELRVHIEQWNSEDRIIAVDAPQAVTLIVKLLDYPAWRAEMNGRPAKIRFMKNTGQILVSVPAGHSMVKLQFTRTIDRTIGGAISLVTGFALAILFFTDRRAPARV
jgi:hypothetical protein